MIKISACIIVRDAQTVITRCIESVKNICDEICIVDTGSTDSTPAIAEKHADYFMRYTGCNNSKGQIVDFSDARNKCLLMATGKWILSIDADEVFINRRPASLLTLLNNKDITAAGITVSRGDREWVAIRLFRNMPEQKFRSPVHEYVDTVGKVGTFRDLIIKDLGQPNKPEHSAARNIRICNHVLEKYGSDLRSLFYRAEAYRSQGDYTKAAVDYIQCLDHPDLCHAYRCATLESLSTCFMFHKEWEAAISAARIITEINPYLAESYCIMGDAYLAMYKIKEAKLSYLKAMQLGYPPPNYNLFVRKQSYFEYPQSQLDDLQKLCDRHGIDYSRI